MQQLGTEQVVFGIPPLVTDLLLFKVTGWASCFQFSCHQNVQIEVRAEGCENTRPSLTFGCRQTRQAPD
jgi:hypothetical protein